MSSVWEWLRQKTPDVTPVTAACRKTYDVTATTTVHVSRAVTAKARDVHECLSDDQRRGDVTRVAKNLSVNGVLYLFRSYGGGPVIDIVSRSWHDGKVDSQKERLKELEVKVAKLEKELNSSRKLSEHSEIIVPPKIAPSKFQDESSQSSAGANQRPENVLRNFMIQQFFGTKLFDNLIIPGAAQSKKENHTAPTAD
ncbi:hypothetical protein RND81_10G128700 [Saponaria officinalis]|uniref:Uncharacterized protein n=1 Tax=Saponaria officinalis TaxID=3572 RepID=A0AAW1I430_SAPOF